MPGYTQYGNVMNLRPTGRRNGGVAKSNQEIDVDMNDLNERKSKFYQVGGECGIQPSVIGAIASRETRAGRLIKGTNGYGDGGNAYGVMQIDKNAHPNKYSKYDWDSVEHIREAVENILVPIIKQIQREHSNWSIDHQLQGGLAAYNMGPGVVTSIERMDDRTADGDYSNDVAARAQRLNQTYHWD